MTWLGGVLCAFISAFRGSVLDWVGFVWSCVCLSVSLWVCILVLKTYWL